MNRNILLASTAIVALLASVAQAAEQSAIQTSSSETHEQMCARWAGHQNLQGVAQVEYIKDCQLDLRVPDKNNEEGDGE
jgi:hypothetical protein